MLKTLRKKTKTLLWVAASIFILATFMGLGGYFFTKTADAVAIVNGEKISYEAFENTYNQFVNNYQNMYNIDINEEMAKNLKKIVLEDMIRQKLILKEAKKQKIKINDTELSTFIQQLPYFQKDGNFNKQIYLAAIKMQYHTTPAAFESMVRQQLVMNQLRDKIVGVVTEANISEAEVAAEIARINKGKKTTVKSQDIAKEKEQIKQSLLIEKRNKTYEDWYNQLKAKAKIENRLEELQN